MKKLIFFLALLFSGAIIYGYKQTGLRILADKNSKQSVSKVFGSTSRPESRINVENIAVKEASKPAPDIIRILTSNKSKTGPSTSLLWRLLYGDPGQNGC
jgi:hypothetical protein